MLETGLVALLTADAGVSALIADRLEPVQGPPDNPTYPYVVYKNLPSPSTEYTFDGRRVFHKVIEFDVFDRSWLGGHNVLAAIEAVLSGYTGVLPDGTRVLFAKQTNEMDNFDNDQRVYRSIGEYEIQYSDQ